VAEVRRVEVGFRTVPGVFAQPPAYEWNVQHRGARYERTADEATVWAGDHDLVDANLVVQYRAARPLPALFDVGERRPDGTSKWDALVRAAAEAALHAEMSRLPSNAILFASRGDVEQAVHTRLATALARLGTGFEVVAVCLCDIHPPLEVVPAFREVTSALEEKEAKKNNADAYRHTTVAGARGLKEEQLLAAVGFERDRVARAEGSAARFLDMVAAHALAPELSRLRLTLETVEQALAGRRKVILDRAPAGARRHLLLGRKGLWQLAPPAPQPQPTEQEIPQEGTEPQ